jgi:hypothetical protein
MHRGRCSKGTPQKLDCTDGESLPPHVAAYTDGESLPPHVAAYTDGESPPPHVAAYTDGESPPPHMWRPTAQRCRCWIESGRAPIQSWTSSDLRGPLTQIASVADLMKFAGKHLPRASPESTRFEWEAIVLLGCLGQSSSTLQSGSSTSLACTRSVQGGSLSTAATLRSQPNYQAW